MTKKMKPAVLMYHTKQLSKSADTMIGKQKTIIPNYEGVKKKIKPESEFGWGELLKSVARHSLSDLRQNGAEAFVRDWLIPLAEDAIPSNAGGVVLPENLPYFQMLCALTAYLEIAASSGARWAQPYLPPLSVTKNLFGGTAYVTDEPGNKLSVLFDPIGQDPAAVINEVRDRFLSLRPDLYWPQHHEQAIEERFGTSLTERQQAVSRERFQKNLNAACAAVRTGKSDALVMMTDQSPVPKTETKPMFPLFLADVFFDKKLSASTFKLRLAAEAADCLAIPYASSPFVCSADKNDYGLNVLSPKLKEMLSAAVTIGRKVPLKTAVEMQGDVLAFIHYQIDSYFLSVGSEITGKGDLDLSDGEIELLDALYQTTKEGLPAQFLGFSSPILGLISRRRIKDSGIWTADWPLSVRESIMLRRLLSNDDVSGTRTQIKAVLQTRRADTGAVLPDFVTEACMPNGGIPSPVPDFYCRLSEIADIRVTRGVPFNIYNDDGRDESFFLRQENACNGFVVRFSVHEGKEKYAAALCLYHYALSNGLDVFNSTDRSVVLACNAGETFGLSPQELAGLFANEAFAGWLKGDTPLHRGTDTSMPSVLRGKIRFAPDKHGVIGAQIRPLTLRRLYAFQNDVFGQAVNDTRPLPPLPKPSAAPAIPVETPVGKGSEDAKRFTSRQADLALKILLGTNPHPQRPDGSADMPNDIRHKGALQKLDALSLHIHGSRLLGGPAPTALLAHGCIRMPVCPDAPPSGGQWKFPPPGLACTLDDNKMETAYLVLRDLLHHKIAAFPEYKEPGEKHPTRYGFAAKFVQPHHRPVVCRFEHDQGVLLRAGNLIDLTAEINPWEVALEKLRLVEDAFRGIAEVFGYERLSAAIQETNVLLSNADSSASHVRMWEKQTQGVPVMGIFYPVPTEEDIERSDTADGIAQIRHRIDDGNIIRSWGGNKIREATLSLQAALDSVYNADGHNTVF